MSGPSLVTQLVGEGSSDALDGCAVESRCAACHRRNRSLHTNLLQRGTALPQTDNHARWSKALGLRSK